MAVLVVADSDNAHLRDTTHKTVTAALQMSGDVDVLVLGQGADAVAAAAGKIAGVRKVILAEGADVGHGVAEAISATIVGLMGGYDALLVPATSAGKNFATVRPAPTTRRVHRSCSSWPTTTPSRPSHRGATRTRAARNLARATRHAPSPAKVRCSRST